MVQEIGKGLPSANAAKDLSASIDLCVVFQIKGLHRLPLDVIVSELLAIAIVTGGLNNELFVCHHFTFQPNVRQLVDQFCCARADDHM